jgi:hypothetical protein
MAKAGKRRSRRRDELAGLAVAGVALARQVVEYFGTDEIDPMLDCDIELRARALLLLHRWRTKKRRSGCTRT